ncbi:MAG: chemotaxis protein CheW [Magnetococcales bacterium]|nr:chemotaxis protein CheW [Magnetococcales bacterium]
MAEEEDEELLGMFVQEATEHLETIEPDLLTLEENGSSTEPEIINRLFRGVHSIKGSAGFFGLTAITKLSHIMENLLGKVREKPAVTTPAVTDSLLAGLDRLQAMIGDISNSENVDAKEQIATIQAVLEDIEGGKAASGDAKPAAPPPPPKAEPEPASDGGEGEAEEEEEAEAEEVPAKPSTKAVATASGAKALDLTAHADTVAHAVSHGQIFYTIALNLPGDTDDKGSYYGKIEALLASVGQVVATEPSDPPAKWSPKQETVRVLITTVLEIDLLLTLLRIPREQIQMVPIPEQLVKIAVETRPSSPKSAPAVKTAVKPKATGSASPPASRIADTEEEVVEERRPRLVKPSAVIHRKATTSAKPAAAAASASSAAASADATKGGNPAIEETLRVSVSLLDELINNAGELVLARNQLTRAASEVALQYPNIAPLVQNLDSITSRIQERVMQARMQPVSVVFNKFPRIIRDLARKLGKKIELELRGGDVDLDKSVIEHLSDPLTHMIRNVADHAIETPQERLEVGKPESGRVELAAYHENGMVNIALSDDGRGIDSDRIKMKCIEKGLITEQQADAMSHEEALNLIFLPGLSMAKKVSDVSGRGVGMDVVRTNIEKLGGTVHIESKVGKGTRIILKLPLTLAIIPAMIVSSNHQRFAIPEIGLVEIVRVAESDRANQIETVGNAPVLRLRNMLLPLVNLAQVLGLQYDTLATANGRSVAYVMVLNVGGNEFGMVVDEVLDSEEIVVKPLPSFFKDNQCFSATTILGDGSVSLIIDYAGVMEQANINFSSIERSSKVDIDDERRDALREKQNIILLETESGLVMGLVHSMVRRVEKISPNLLVSIGHLPYVRYDRKTFRALYPDQVLGLDGMGCGSSSGGGMAGDEEDNALCMVVPNIPNIQAGLIFSRIIDTRETFIDLDTRAIQAEGLFGSTQIDDRVVLFPDINVVLEKSNIMPPQLRTRIQGEGMRALVVDDTPFLRALTSSYLTSAGFEVDEAEDGQMAITMLKTSFYDLLVTDINMPVMDGFELAGEIGSSQNPDMPMIATTSSISSDLEQRCIRAGFVSCVSTIDKSRLLGVIAMLQPEYA